MDQSKLLQLVNELENNARQLLETAVALKKELSGGSDSSNSQVLSLEHQHQIIAKRKKHMLKK